MCVPHSCLLAVPTATIVQIKEKRSSKNVEIFPWLCRAMTLMITTVVQLMVYGHFHWIFLHTGCPTLLAGVIGVKGKALASSFSAYFLHMTALKYDLSKIYWYFFLIHSLPWSMHSFLYEWLPREPSSYLKVVLISLIVFSVLFNLILTFQKVGLAN